MTQETRESLILRMTPFFGKDGAARVLDASFPPTEEPRVQPKILVTAQHAQMITEAFQSLSKR